MAFRMHMVICFFFVLVMSTFFSGCRCNGSDTISVGKSLFPNQTIVSKEAKFELGFFTPGNSSNHYVGLWYKNIPGGTVVWVANRNNPIPYSWYNNSVLEMSNGNLALIVNSKRIWMLAGPSYASEAVILDTGNFVLRNASGIIWQSLDHPSGTWLPGGMIGFRWSSNTEAQLITWRDGDDPGTGNFSLGLEPNGGGELVIKNGSQKLWSGVWLGSDLYNFSYVSRDDATYLTYSVYNESMLVRIMIRSVGRAFHYVWSGARQDWVVLATQPYDPNFCTTDARCGPNAICDVNYAPACRCLNGFVPRVKQDWDSFDFSNGCERARQLQCDKGKTGFTKVNNTRLPKNPVRSPGECKFMCSVNCSCNAYAYGSKGECLLFIGNLLDLERQPNNSVGKDLYGRTESAEHSGKGNRNTLAVALVVPITAATLISCFCFCYLQRKLKSKVSWGVQQNLLLLDLNSNEPAYNSDRNGHREEKNNHYELPIFSFSSIAASTNNFSITNKLGEGGFGPVYKGQLLNRQFVAVKRLSGGSRQGLVEFRNETKLIAKLQHRNLVGILGCCIEKDEKIIVYEYMPNKSLDLFLFEPTRKYVLDWKKRVHIIEGIAQGLLYLHHYSRLRIVHRDLKASNILLDDEMEPKISDFGMARIFGGNISQADTKRIVGTYGYMSPEYALHGTFSKKSDVYSFGVLLLEIVSGRRNGDFYDEDRQLFLIAYAWKLWNEEKIVNLMDPAISDPSMEADILRYANVGLLCVQESAADRPDISTVLSMLSRDIVELPRPKKPAFVGIQKSADTKSPQKDSSKCSVNDVTMSIVEGR